MAERPTIMVHGFKTTYERSFNENGQPTGKMDRPVDWVMYSPVHMAMYSQIVERVDWLRPPASMDNDQDGLKLAAMRHKWAMIEPAYLAWKQGHEIPLNGTPLGAWPGINEAQANAFRAVGIKTVEHVAEITDAIMNRVNLPGVRELKKQAQAFLDATDKSSLANQVLAQDQKIEALQEQLAAALSMLDQQSRSKPRKAKEEAEAA